MDSSESSRSEVAPETLDELFSVLSNEPARDVVQYFRRASDSTATFDSLVDFSVERAEESVDRERRAIAIHHSALPKLDEIGVVDYDARNDAITYHGHPAVELIVSHATRRDGSRTSDDDPAKAIRSQLEAAKRADDEKRKNYHIREALQYLSFERSTEE